MVPWGNLFFCYVLFAIRLLVTKTVAASIGFIRHWGRILPSTKIVMPYYPNASSNTFQVMHAQGVLQTAHKQTYFYLPNRWVLAIVFP